GTTRDVLDVELDLGGQTARLLDTPGFDLDAEGVDAEAQLAAREHLASADVALWVVDATAAGDLDDERARIAHGRPVVLAWNKVDLARARPAPPSSRADAIVAVSAATGAGLGELEAAPASALAPPAGAAAGAPGRAHAAR